MRLFRELHIFIVFLQSPDQDTHSPETLHVFLQREAALV